MGLLPAEVPDIPEVRSEIVPARLARKVAPLFGIPWERGPFGTRTWVCDYNKITLSEIARGAPQPGRGQAGRTLLPEPGGWAIVDRVGVTGAGGSLPNEIPNATLNRFRPDTKAAVVLTAANRLLTPVAGAVDSALELLVAADGAALPLRLRLAAWAALVLEVFRTQPALLAAAIHARTVQRELLIEWYLPLADTLADLPLARCEVGAPHGDKGGSASRPRDLDVADRTVRGLEVRAPDEVVDRLLRQLMAIGTRQSSSHLWLSERVPGQLVVEALVPPTELVNRYIAQLDHLLDAEPAGREVLPRVPATAEVSALPLLGRRAVVIALLTVLRQVQFDPEQRERTRAPIVPLLAEVALLATETLGPDDPLTVLGRCRAADMLVHTLRHDRRHDLAEPVAELMSQAERCVDLADAGVVDRGAAAEAISSANVEINIVRRTNAADREAKLPSPEHLDAWLRRSWDAYRRILEISRDWPGQGDQDSQMAVGHHLHNYASYLTTHPDSEPDLLAAVELFETVVIPARELYWKRTRSFLPLRQSLQIASRATAVLTRRAADAARPEEARRWAAKGYAWVTRALDDQETDELLAGSSEPAAHFCLLAVPALLTAVEHGVEGAGSRDVALADRLLAVAEGWARRVTDGDVVSYSHYDRLVDLRRRIELLS